jgi:galactokinase
MMNESGLSSYHQLKNCYVSSEDENLPKALRKVKEIDPTCYCRVHGGGFAGTIQAFVPKEKLVEYKETLDKVFGEGSCQVLRIRPVGGVKIL